MRSLWLVPVLMLVAACGDGTPAKAPPVPPPVPPTVWLTSYPAAREAARARGLAILADFTGSDWCGPCIQLKQRVFSSPAFARWAATRVVLLELDFPRGPIDEALRTQNRALAQSYAVRSYPTVLFLSAEGRVLGRREGYGGESTEVWIQQADVALAGDGD